MWHCDITGSFASSVCAPGWYITSVLYLIVLQLLHWLLWERWVFRGIITFESAVRMWHHCLTCKIIPGFPSSSKGMRQSLGQEAWLQWLIIPLTYIEWYCSPADQSYFTKSSIIMAFKQQEGMDNPSVPLYWKWSTHRNKIINGLEDFNATSHMQV